MKATKLPRIPYCGLPGICAHTIFNERFDDLRVWFSGHEVYYTHRARVAIRLACSILGITTGDQVLAPAYNCGSEISAVLDSGAEVVLYQVDRWGTPYLQDVERRFTKKTKAVYLTHYFGFPQAANAFSEMCKRRGVYLIEDCALSLFSMFRGSNIGSVGDVSVFSLSKTLPVPDGGVLTVNNLQLSGRFWRSRRPSWAKILRQTLPLVKNGLLQKPSVRSHLYAVVRCLGKNKRGADQEHWLPEGLPEMPAHYYYNRHISNRAISHLSERILARVDVSAVIRNRRRNFLLYQKMLAGVQGLEAFRSRLGEGVCPLWFPVIVTKRHELCRKLNRLGIAAIAWWAGYHRGFAWSEYPEACHLKDSCLVLPLHHQLEDEQVEYIARTVKQMVVSAG